MDRSEPMTLLPDINAKNPESSDAQPLYDLIIVNFDPLNQDTQESSPVDNLGLD